MDEDDDFFSMRGRFRVPEKRKRSPNDDDSADSETGSSMPGLDSRLIYRFR